MAFEVKLYSLQHLIINEIEWIDSSLGKQQFSNNREIKFQSETKCFVMATYCYRPLTDHFDHFVVQNQAKMAFEVKLYSLQHLIINEIEWIDSSLGKQQFSNNREIKFQSATKCFVMATYCYRPLTDHFDHFFCSEPS